MPCFILDESVGSDLVELMRRLRKVIMGLETVRGVIWRCRVVMVIDPLDDR